ARALQGDHQQHEHAGVRRVRRGVRRARAGAQEDVRDERQGRVRHEGARAVSGGVMDSFLAEVVAGLKATSPLEAVAVIFGLAYSVFAIVRSRWCWAAAFVSSIILIYLSWISQLPMQASLQAYYVAMAIYGYWHWTRDEGK